ncbi:MAG: serine/threonine-protein kinase [Planctomycetota bacterium]
MSKDPEKLFLERLVSDGRLTDAQAREIYEEVRGARAKGGRVAAAALAVERHFIDVETAQGALAKQKRQIAQCTECGAKWLVSPREGEKRVCLDCEADLVTYHGEDLDGLRIVFIEDQERTVEDPLIGQVLQNCRIEERIGQGGRGVVYRGMDPGLQRRVAIKLLQEHLAERSKAYVHRFVEEARSAAKLEHRNIVSIYAVGKGLGYYYIVMQYIDGGSVSQKLARLGRLWPDEAVAIAAQMADGLAYAHRQGIIHLDVKPDNIMIDRDNVARITDFGLAREVTAEGHELPGKLQGTPKYMSPEQCRGEDVDRRSDIYSLGITLIRLLTGQTPYGGQVLDVINGHRSPKPVPVLPRTAEFSDDLRAVVRKMVAKKREDRYQSMEETADDLHRIQRGEETKALAELMAKRGAGQKVLELEPEPELGGLGALEEAPQPAATSSAGWVFLVVGVIVVAALVVGALLLGRGGARPAGALRGRAQELFDDAIVYAAANPSDFQGIIDRLNTALAAGPGTALEDEISIAIDRHRGYMTAQRALARAASRLSSARIGELREAYDGVRSVTDVTAGNEGLSAQRDELERSLRSRLGERGEAMFREAQGLEREGRLDDALRLYGELVEKGLPELKDTSLAKTRLEAITRARSARQLTEPFRTLKEDVENQRWYQGRKHLAELDARRQEILNALSSGECSELEGLERLVASHAHEITVAAAPLGDFRTVEEAVLAASKEDGGKFVLAFPGGGQFPIGMTLDAVRMNIREIRGEGEQPTLELLAVGERPEATVQVTEGELVIRNAALVVGRLSQGRPAETGILLSRGFLELEKCSLRGFGTSIRIRPSSSEGARLRASNCVFAAAKTAIALESAPAGGVECGLELSHCVVTGRPTAGAKGVVVSFVGSGRKGENRWSIRLRDTIFEGLAVAFQEHYSGSSPFVEGINTTWDSDFNCYFDNQALYVLSLENSPWRAGKGSQETAFVETTIPSGLVLDRGRPPVRRS